MASRVAVSRRSRPVSVPLIAVLCAGQVLLASCETDPKRDEEYTGAGSILVALVTSLAVTAAQLHRGQLEPELAPGREVDGGSSAGGVVSAAATRPRRVLWKYPHTSRPPMGVTQIVSGVLSSLRPGSGGTSLSIRTLVDALGGSFLDQAIDAAVAQHPQLLTRVPHGVRFDYGQLYRDSAGNLISGRAEFTCPDISAGLSDVKATCGVTYDGYTVDGSATQVDWLEWVIDLDLGPGERVAGDLTVTGGTWPLTTKPEPASVTGSAHFDTAICAAYPISGSIQVTIGGETTTVTFDDTCDGSYILDLPGARYWALTMNLYRCNSGYSVEISFVEENGALTVDRGIQPWNSDAFGAGRWTASGWINDSEVRIEFSAPADPGHWNPNLTPGVSGVFFGKKHKLLDAYSGELTYTLSESPPAVAEACSVTHTKVRDGHNYIYSCRGKHCR